MCVYLPAAEHGSDGENGEERVTHDLEEALPLRQAYLDVDFILGSLGMATAFAVTTFLLMSGCLVTHGR